VALVILRLIWGCLLALAFAAPAVGQALPEGKGREPFRRICRNCHGIDVATKLRLSADEWRAIVDDMVNQGAIGTDDEFQLIVDYLSANFGKPGEGSDTKAAAQKINVNTASIRELTTVLGLSNRDAEAIVQYRKDRGPFKDWPDLRKVPGIDLRKLEDQKDKVAFTESAH
jgi:competence protein ComEA